MHLLNACMHPALPFKDLMNSIKALKLIKILMLCCINKISRLPIVAYWKSNLYYPLMQIPLFARSRDFTRATEAITKSML